MKFINLFMLSGMLFTILFAACEKDSDESSNTETPAPKQYFYPTLLKKASDYAKERGYYSTTKKDTLLFIITDFGPLPNDTSVVYKTCDSIARDIYKRVYEEYVNQLPNNWLTSSVHYYPLDYGYYYTVTTSSYGSYYTYYSGSGLSKGLPHGHNPFSIMLEYEDILLKTNEFINRDYDPLDRKKFP